MGGENVSVSWTLVTGAKGFIGSAVTRCLQSAGRRVAGIGHGLIPPAEQEQRGLVYWLNGTISISNLHLLEQELGTPEGVIHLAGGSSVGKSLQEPQGRLWPYGREFHGSA